VKKLTTKKIINEITRIRANNNLLWMSLLQLAVTARPNKARQIIRLITTNDRTISKWTSQL
jgi:hypothetical protein